MLGEGIIYDFLENLSRIYFVIFFIFSLIFIWKWIKMLGRDSFMINVCIYVLYRLKKYLKFMLENFVNSVFIVMLVCMIYFYRWCKIKWKLG